MAPGSWESNLDEYHLVPPTESDNAERELTVGDSTESEEALEEHSTGAIQESVPLEQLAHMLSGEDEAPPYLRSSLACWYSPNPVTDILVEEKRQCVVMLAACPRCGKAMPALTDIPLLRT